MKLFRHHVAGAAIMVAAGMITSGAGYLLGRNSVRPAAAFSESTAAAIPVRTEGLPASVPGSFRETVERVKPAVVEINVVSTAQPLSGGPFDFFGLPQQEFRRQGVGSGVIVRRSGSTVYVVTNNHVVGDAEQIRVKLVDDREFDARLVGRDSRRDLAVVSFETRDEVPLAALGDSDALQPGDWVLAIGNPMGFESTVTAGIVSAVGRQTSPDSGVAGLTDYIQTDAAINQGNSGGALINTRGEVIGINTWIASPSGGNVGLGFAIPINNARKAIDDLVVKGKVDYGWLGVTTGDATAPALRSLGAAVESGALVHGVFDGSPARSAGLRPGDVITSVNDRRITGSADLVRNVANLAPGSQVRFALIRDAKEVVLTVRLNTRADDDKIAAAKLWPGFAVAEPQNGDLIVASVDQGGRADTLLRPGDLIRRVNGTRVGNMREFYRALNASDGREVLFGLERNGAQITVGISR